MPSPAICWNIQNCKKSLWSVTFFNRVGDLSKDFYCSSRTLSVLRMFSCGSNSIKKCLPIFLYFTCVFSPFFRQQPLCSFLTCWSYSIHPSWMDSTIVLMLFLSCSGLEFWYAGIHYYLSDVCLAGMLLSMMESSCSRSMAQSANSVQSGTYLSWWLNPLLRDSEILVLSILSSKTAHSDSPRRKLTDQVVDKAESLSKL